MSSVVQMPFGIKARRKYRRHMRKRQKRHPPRIRPSQRGLAGCGRVLCGRMMIRVSPGRTRTALFQMRSCSLNQGSPLIEGNETHNHCCKLPMVIQMNLPHPCPLTGEAVHPSNLLSRTYPLHQNIQHVLPRPSSWFNAKPSPLLAP